MNLDKLNQKNFIKILLPVIFFCLFSLSIVAEIIPFNDGAGFDGEFYRNVFQGFSRDFLTSGYDSFRIQRIFPFCLLNLVFMAFSIPLTNQNMIIGMDIAHYLNFAIQIFLFFKFSTLFKWKNSTFAILFACLFFNYFSTKNCGYEPFQTDSFAITIALASYYFLQKERKAISFAISLLGLVTWPLITATAGILILFHDKSQKTEPESTTKNSKRIYILLLIAYAIVLLGLIAGTQFTHKEHIIHGILMANYPFGVLLASATGLIIPLYFIFKSEKYIFPVHYTYKTYIQTLNIKTLLGLAIPVVAVKILLAQFTNDEFFFDGKLFFLQIFIRPLKQSIFFFVNHIVYWGILPILIILSLKNFTRKFTEKSPGHFLVLLLLMFFSLDTEARHLATFLPIVIIILGSVIDEYEISSRKAILLVFLQLLLSHFYIPINGPELPDALANGNFSSDVAQRYFMNFGPWITLKNFIICTIISIGVALIIRKVLKNSITK